MVKIQNMSFSYSDKEIFNNFNLNIERGEFLGIIGPNGSGKSTLLKLILGVLKPNKGKILIDERDISKIKRKRLAQMMSAVLQDFNPTLDFTVKELVSLGRSPYLRLLEEESVEDERIIQKALEDTKTAGFKNKPLSQLSGGEKQSVLIAKCFAQNTPILLLDEIIAHLDLKHIQEILDTIISKNKDRQLTVICVLHDINVASLYCDKIALIDEGNLIVQGSPDEVIKIETIKKIYSVDCNIINHPKRKVPQIILNRAC